MKFISISEAVNKQNCRIWEIESPHVNIMQSVQPQSLNVWFGFWSGSNSGQFFIENEQRATVKVTVLF